MHLRKGALCDGRCDVGFHYYIMLSVRSVTIDWAMLIGMFGNYRPLKVFLI